MEPYQEEVERAIDRVKRSKLDKWMRAEWHRAGARDHWSKRRKAKWLDWKRRHPNEAATGRSCPATHTHVTKSKVWVKGHVPEEFLHWVERYWSHEDETRVMLSECCFEAWER